METTTLPVIGHNLKLYHSSSSPYARKVMVAAHELGLADRIEHLPGAPHPIMRDATIRASNPLGQVPTLVMDDGEALFDSRVICEYLDAVAGGDLFGTGARRWRNLSLAAMGDGLLGAALLVRYEGAARPAELKCQAWIDGQNGKIADVIGRLERLASTLDGQVDIATITFACGFGYLDFRFPDLAWRQKHPATADWYGCFRERPSMKATEPTG